MHEAAAIGRNFVPWDSRRSLLLFGESLTMHLAVAALNTFGSDLYEISNRPPRLQRQSHFSPHCRGIFRTYLRRHRPSHTPLSAWLRTHAFDLLCTAKLSCSFFQVVRFKEVKRGLRSRELVAPQGFEPRLNDSESSVLPLNEGATQAVPLGPRGTTRRHLCECNGWWELGQTSRALQRS